ncbi:hypothetical protein BGZ65_004951 [Modicella reniformis]|uniref:Uncharacterized protein n=1 Tax=Modicella reniformis TaxID=1440133 RepID=A0A9P6SV50_9FUNG|nr:hypothetical protein BGZ65_004951 [Modicella reniformis]
MAAETVFDKDGIIPDVVDSFQSMTMLSVSYSTQDVMIGNTMTVEETQQVPKVSFMADSPMDKFTLIMTDPDAPSRNDPKMREFRLWIVTNIPGVNDNPEDLLTKDLNKGTVVTEYMGPAPPAGSGPHRYVFLLYKQPGPDNQLTPDALATLATPLGPDRRGFQSRSFARKAGLELVGVNYFFAETRE